MLPTDSPLWRTGAARKVRTSLTGIGGRNSGRPISRVWLWKSRSRRGSLIPRNATKNLMPSGIFQNCRLCSGVIPEATQSSISPVLSLSVITPYREPVSTRALSRTPPKTVSKSRVSLMRRLASLNRDSRSRSVFTSRSNTSVRLIFSSASGGSHSGLCHGREVGCVQKPAIYRPTPGCFRRFFSTGENTPKVSSILSRPCIHLDVHRSCRILTII